MGGNSNSGPTLQQQQLQTEQALTNANLNLEENDQRKVILNSLSGTRNFRESALSRSVRGNNDNPGAPIAGGPGTSQQINTYGQITTTPSVSLLDYVNSGGSQGSAGTTGSTGGGRGGAGGGRGGSGNR